MARIFKDSSVLNQFGSPSINSNTIANRPAYGQTGRLFVSTDTLAIYRDTGSGWDNLTAGGGSQNLEQVTTVGNQTTQGINIINSGTKGLLISSTIADLPTTYNFALYSVGFSVLKSTYNISDSNTNVASIFQNNINVDTSTSYNAFFNANYSNLDLKVPTGSTLTLGVNANNGAILALNSFSGVGGGSIINSQVGSYGFRAISPIISKTNYTIRNNISIDKYAGLVIYGAEGISSAGKLVITDYYSLLINPSDYFTNSPTVTNRWGIYQAGANDNNYFASNLSIGTTILSGQKLNVLGSGKFVSTLYIDNTDVGQQTLLYFGYSFLKRLKIGYVTTGTSILENNVLFAQIIIDDSGNFNIASRSDNPSGIKFYTSLSTTSGYSEAARFENNGSFLIGTQTNTNIVKLKVNGEQEWSNITLGTGTHTTSGNHLPIWVNGTKYWLALLNPPI